MNATVIISEDLWSQIFLNLTDDEFAPVKSTCSSWRDLFAQQIFWKNRSVKRWGEDIVPNKIDALAHVTGVLDFDKSRYFIPTISDPNGRLKIDWSRYYRIRSKLEWIVIDNWGEKEELDLEGLDEDGNEDNEEKDEEVEDGIKSSELDLTTFNLEEFLNSHLPPEMDGYDIQMNQSIYLLLDLIDLFFDCPSDEQWSAVMAKVDSWLKQMVPEDSNKLLEARWRLCQSAFEKRNDELAPRKAFSSFRAFCYGIKDFNPRVLNVFKEVITKMIDIGKDDEGVKLSMPLVLEGFEKQIRKQNEKGFLELHDMLFNLASERFHCQDSSTSVRANALSALMLTSVPSIPEFIDKVLDLAIEGMKSTEPSIVTKGLLLMNRLVEKGHKFTAEKTRTLVELAMLREADMQLRGTLICHMITKETSHVITDEQLDWLNRIEQLKKGEDLYFIANQSLGKLKVAFGSRMDKYVPQYRELLLNRDYWQLVAQKDEQVRPSKIVHQYLELIAEQPQSKEWKDIIHKTLFNQFGIQLFSDDVTVTYVDLLFKHGMPLDTKEKLEVWEIWIQAVFRVFSAEMKQLGANRFVQTARKGDTHGFNEENILLLKNQLDSRSNEDKSTVERILQVKQFKKNRGAPKARKNEENLNFIGIQEIVHEKYKELGAAIRFFIRSAKEMKKQFDPFVVDTMNAYLGIARFLIHCPLSKETVLYGIIGEFFSEIYVPFENEQNSLQTANKLLAILSMDLEARPLIRPDMLLENVACLTENIFMALIMNSQVTSQTLVKLYQPLGSGSPSDRVPVLFDTLILTRPSLAYQSLKESRMMLYGFATWLKTFHKDEVALKTYVVIATRFGINFANAFRTSNKQDRKYSLEETRTMCLELRNRSTDKYMIRLLHKMIILLSCCIVDTEIEQFNQLLLHLDLKSTKGKEHKEVLKKQAQYGSMIENALKSSQFDTTCDELNEMVNKSDRTFAFFLSLDNDLLYN